MLLEGHVILDRCALIEGCAILERHMLLKVCTLLEGRKLFEMIEQCAIESSQRCQTITHKNQKTS